MNAPFRNTQVVWASLPPPSPILCIVALMSSLTSTRHGRAPCGVAFCMCRDSHCRRAPCHRDLCHRRAPHTFNELYMPTSIRSPKQKAMSLWKTYVSNVFRVYVAGASGAYCRCTSNELYVPTSLRLPKQKEMLWKFYIASLCFKCLKCFACMLQVLQTHVAGCYVARSSSGSICFNCFKCFKCMLQVLCLRMLQQWYYTCFNSNMSMFGSTLPMLQQ
jgi:hypothetical protein